MIPRIKKFLFTNTTDKQIVIKNTLWLSGSEILVRIFRFILILYVARILGAEGWGSFSYALSFIGLFLMFSDAGISTLFIKEYVNKQTHHIKAMVLMKFLLLVISGIIAIIAGFYFATLPIQTLVFPVVMLLVFDSIRDFITALLRSQEKMELEALIKIITNVTLVIASIILISIDTTSTSLAFGYMIGNTLGLIASLIIAFPALKKLKNIIRSNILKKEHFSNVIKLASPIALTGLATTIITNVDSTMLGIWNTATDVGWYASAQRIFQFTLIIPGIYVTALFPTLSKIYSENRERFFTITQKSFSLLSVIGIPIAFGGFFLADKLTTFLFGIEYLPAGAVFAWLILAVLFTFPGALFYTLAVITETQKRISFHIFSAILINIIANIFLIPKLGVVGAAIGATITQTYLFILNAIFFKKICRLSKRDFRDIFVGLIFMIIFLFSTPKFHIITQIIISILIYLGVLFLFKNQSVKIITNIIKTKEN